ncbi:MAG: PorT family protein [Bacteroidales bacterium]|nr:PorT family protein [Bacteroidales bacterium]MBO7647564.1 PorT family protein [Bacteroidales bacterium]
MKKRICVLVLLLSICSTTLFGQSNRWSFGVPNLLKYDKKTFHFGFLIGYNQFNFTIASKPNLAEYDSLMVINTSPLSGFNLGIVTNLRLGKYFDLRFIPGLAFGDRIVNYSILYQSGNQLITKKNAESVYLDLPLMIKFKSSRMLNNIRTYVIAGAQYSLDLISAAKKQSSNPQEIILKLYPNDFQGFAGIGFDFYCSYFKFSTELKMSFGLVNLLKEEDNMYATSVTSLRSKLLQISFTFE